MVAAIKRQAEKFTHTCFMVLPYEPAVRLAEVLGAAVPGDFPKASLFINSRAEAVENRRTKKPAGEAAQALVRCGRDSGLVVLLTCGSHGNAIRVLMPLVITDEQLEKGLGILEAGLAKLPAD